MKLEKSQLLMVAVAMTAAAPALAQGATAPTPAAPPADSAAPLGSAVAPAAAPEASTTPAAPAAPLAKDQPAPALHAKVEAAAPTPTPGGAGPSATAAPVEVKLDPAPLTFTGTFFSRLELRDGYDRLGVSSGRFLEGDATVFRARFGLKTAAMDIGAGKVSAQFTPQVAGFYGNLPSTLETPTLGAYEAYGRFTGSGFEVDVGRFALNYGDAYVVGNLDWHQVGRSFDGVRAHLAPADGRYFIDVFATQIDERGVASFPVQAPAGTTPAPNAAGPDSAPGAGDIYFTGIYADVGKLLAPELALEPYLLGKIYPHSEGLPRVAGDPTQGIATTTTAAFATLGARVAYKLGAADLRFEGGVQGGSTVSGAGVAAQHAIAGRFQDKSAYSADLELGYSVVPKRLRIAVEADYASGDDSSSAGTDEGWDELFPTAHKWLGLMDVTPVAGQKRRNIHSAVLHLWAKPLGSLVLKADGHIFGRPRRAAAGRSKFVGTELDLQAIYTIGKGLTARALYGAFLPAGDQSFARGVGDNGLPAHYGEVEVRLDF